ncbi:MAG: pyrroline-5-carboxylate reductase [Clostridiales Family XIII bacterium]|jgi:pyrroline-5-carboxylate reductase|nr:pyrroline-5-carboxylate reductase [Clostridiales Family XIII bacterium]
MVIGFIGAGNMGGAIIKGYASKLAEANAHEDATSQLAFSSIIVYDKDEAKLEKLTTEFSSIQAAATVDQVLLEADAIVLATKPQIFDDLLDGIDLKGYLLAEGKVWVSIAAGISIAYLERKLTEGTEVSGACACNPNPQAQKKPKVIRVMPNLPAMVGVGTAGLSRNGEVTDEEFAEVRAVFGAIGKAEEVDESLMDTVVAVSGSGPAYVFMFIDAMIKAGVEFGMDESIAKTLAAQTVKGAAQMVQESDDSPNQLKINVCSPGGTTIEAVDYLEKEADFYATIKEAMKRVSDKSKAMTKK